MYKIWAGHRWRVWVSAVERGLVHRKSASEGKGNTEGQTEAELPQMAADL